MNKRHQEERMELHQRQAAGLRTYAGLEAYRPPEPAVAKDRAPEITDKDGERASEIIGNGIENPRENGRLDPEAGTAVELGGGNENFRVKDGIDLAGGVINAMAKVAERLFDGFLGGGESVQKPPPATNPPGKPLPEHDAEKARRAAEEKAAAEQREAEIVELYAYWEERRGRRRERDRD
jgi:hypothetical protein